jgi:hypothetical protein
MLHGVVLGDVAKVSKVYAACIYTENHQAAQFDPENGDRLYLRNVGNTASNHMV